ncbi:MAG: hypothetical protein JF601_06485 [Acidobacteria bacterium]|nr:hypothetical protein [Acidobacteriota bacterium]
MQFNCRALIAAALFIASSVSARAQQPIDPSGHWQGAVQTPSMQVPFDLDLAKDAAGRFRGALSVPAQKIKGLPLTKVAVEGSALNFQARSDQPFTGVLSQDRQSITGDLLISGNSLPFTLTRNGAAQIEAPRRSAALSKQLEGTWTATLIVEGTPHQLVMTLVNHPDGSASGRIVNEGEGGLELPIAIAQQGSAVTIETLPVASTVTATLNQDGTELDGTIAQGQATAHVTFRRSK